MNATVRLAAPDFARPVAPRPVAPRPVAAATVVARPVPVSLAKTLPATPDTLAPCPIDETEICIHTLELIERLVDAIMSAFTLNEYEEQIVHHMLFGRSCHAIGRRLGIRETTVHKHMHRVFAKTNTEDRRGLYDLGLRLAAVQSITGARPRMAA